MDTLNVTNETIICDKLRLNQVLLNILSSAMKYTEPGGTVSVRIIQTDDAPEGYASIIILTAYDWTDIETKAKEAGVTAFCPKPLFLSELREILTAPYKELEEAGEEAPTARLLLGKKILLVEDNELNQEIARTVLEEAGLVIDTADDGTEAVEAIQAAQPGACDLILKDIQMPVMDGYTAARTIRAMDDPAKVKIPIVAMTANAFEEDRQKAFDAGMDGHVPKPIDIPKLMETLKAILVGEE